MKTLGLFYLIAVASDRSKNEQYTCNAISSKETRTISGSVNSFIALNSSSEYNLTSSVDMEK